MIVDENDGGRQHFIFFEIAKKKLLNGKVKICIEKVKKMLKIFERSKMLKCMYFLKDFNFPQNRNI